jgi:TetR/AcrR family transcriptional regulator, regulator of biofilm formation and stress response
MYRTFRQGPRSGMSAPVNTKRRNPRRQEILEAALRLVGEGGVKGVTHRAVAEEAGVPLASTTYYFDSKGALVEEAFELVIARSIEYVRRYTASPPEISQAELIDRMVDFADAQVNDPHALVLAQYELMLEASRAEYLRPLVHRWTIAYMDGFKHLVRSAGLPQPEQTAEIISNVVEGAVLNQVTTPTDDFLEIRLRPLLTDLISALDCGLPQES